MRIFLVLCLASFSFQFSDPSLPSQITNFISDDIPFLLSFYKGRHQHPEVSLQEEQTAQKLAAELRNVGFTVTEGVGGYGIVGILKNGEGPLVLYRTDMDALPMYEKTGLEYASKVEIDLDGIKTGTMHSCGHDMHMTTWLGVARTMVQFLDQWKGTLMLIGQPAEEIGMGSKMMLEAGLYERFGVPDYGIGLHCSPEIAAGRVGMGKGLTMANAESIDIKVFGVGAHGASPHMSIDPVVVASMMVMELQTIVSRNMKPTEPAVVTVGAIQGGIKHNIIPDEVILKLTVRTFSEDVRQMIHGRIREIARGVAIAAGLPEDKMPQVIIPESYAPANYNNPELVDKLVISAGKIVGIQNVVEAEPQMVAEDFSRYGLTGHQVPTVLFWLGTVPEERMRSGDKPGLHSPRYYPEAEKSIRTGVSVTTQMLLDLFAEQN
ncbi:MAG TPA: amidohydrolase [Saprospiraceae bacterium]|nr:amidohydrolase [Saprospiraceae bacterium]